MTSWQPSEQRWAEHNAKRQAILREKWEKIHAAEAQIEAANRAIRLAEWEANIREQQLEREFTENERRVEIPYVPTMWEAA